MFMLSVGALLLTAGRAASLRPAQFFCSHRSPKRLLAPFFKEEVATCRKWGQRCPPVVLCWKIANIVTMFANYYKKYPRDCIVRCGKPAVRMSGAQFLHLLLRFAGR